MCNIFTVDRRKKQLPLNETPMKYYTYAENEVLMFNVKTSLSARVCVPMTCYTYVVLRVDEAAY